MPTRLEVHQRLFAPPQPDHLIVTDSMPPTVPNQSLLEGGGEQFHTTPDTSEVIGNRMSHGWPTLDGTALHGLIGEIVDHLSPHTEADAAALLIQGLVAFGNIIGRGPHFTAEADRHALNLYAALVGETSKGRKGTSWGHIRRLYRHLDAAWADERVLSGLSSGEGLIWAVHDEITKQEPVRDKGRVTGEYQTIVIDPGVEDKRLLVQESEFASTMRVLERDGSTLSPVIRQAWDSGHLRIMTKNCPARATNAHVSIVAHITRDELLRRLGTDEATNGFATVSCGSASDVPIPCPRVGVSASENWSHCRRG